MTTDGGGAAPGRQASSPTPNALALMRSWASVRLLLLAVLLGVPIAAGAFWFLKITELLQEWAFTDVPNALGYDSVPARWPLVPLVLAGMIVGAVIRYLPGDGGESPAEGFKAGGIAPARTLPGILLAAVASIGLGAVLGPEMPLIAVGGGLACLTVRLANRDVPAQTGAVAVATGSFAAISTLLGTPLAGAFLLLEASSVGGAAATAVLLPGLLGAGIGSLVFTGLNSVTGYARSRSPSRTCRRSALRQSPSSGGPSPSVSSPLHWRWGCAGSRSRSGIGSGSG